MGAFFCIFVLPLFYVIFRVRIFTPQKSLKKKLFTYILAVVGINGIIAVSLFLLGKAENIVFKLNTYTEYFIKYAVLSLCIGTAFIVVEMKLCNMLPARICRKLETIEIRGIDLRCKTRQIFVEHFKSIGLKWFTCIVTYFMIIAFNLVNVADGMWLGPYLYNGNWILSLGRWFVRYWDKLVFGIHVNPNATVVALLLFVLGTEVMVSTFGIKVGSWKDYLISLLFLCNMIVCVTVSYLQVSRVFALAFLLAMICVKCIVCSQEKKIFVLYGAVCLAFVTGIYQAYLGCILLVALVYLILMVQDRCDYRKIRRYLLCGGMTGVMGFCLYEMLLYINLWWFKVSMSSYNGADEISVGVILRNFFSSMKKAYIAFFQYFAGRFYRWNILSDRIQIICLTILVLYIFWRAITSLRQRARILLWAVLLLLIPVAANVTFILAPASSLQPQQTAQLALVMPMMGVCLFRGMEKCSWMRAIIVSLTVLMLHGMAGQTLVEQEAMYEGTLAAEKIAESIFQSLVENNLYERGKRYALIGAPCDSPMFYATPLYYKANNYAKVSGPWWDSYLDHWSWRGIFQFRLGINLPFCDEGLYEDLLDLEKVQDMPLYPSEGSMQEINGVIIIKVS